MSTAQPQAAIREELRPVEEDLARIRETAADLRRRIGERADYPTDPAELSALIEEAEEQEFLADELEARREGLLPPRELTMNVTVYGDFNSLLSYLASQRADWLVRTATAEIDWRAVEHCRQMPVTGIRSDPGDSGWQRELAETGALALPGERLPAAPPPVVSNTRASVAAYAEAVTDGDFPLNFVWLESGHNELGIKQLSNRYRIYAGDNIAVRSCQQLSAEIRPWSPCFTCFM